MYPQIQIQSKLTQIQPEQCGGSQERVCIRYKEIWPRESGKRSMQNVFIDMKPEGGIGDNK